MFSPTAKTDATLIYRNLTYVIIGLMANRAERLQEAEAGKPGLAKKQILKLKQYCRAWQKTDAATEGCETHSLVGNLINAIACNSF